MTRVRAEERRGGAGRPQQGTEVGPMPCPGAARTRQKGVAFSVKRAIDLVGASAVLLVAAPVLAAAAVAVRVSSPGPILFHQERIGRWERTFTVLKFRSMRIDADERVHSEHIRALLQGGSSPTEDVSGSSPRHPDDAAVPGSFKLRDDDRVTPVGRILRMTSMDELPQLLNVIRGEMSLVGPRPDIPEVVESYEPWHHRRFDVLPGMTGLWQVSGRDVISPAEMLRLDVRYADTWTLRRDLAILLRTVPAVLEKLRHGTV